MFRRIVKTGSCRASHWIGIDRFAGELTQLPVVLGYHRVVEDFSSEAKRAMPPLLTSVRIFEQHLDWVGKRYRFVSLDELGSTLEQSGKFERPVAAITFDDGYRDVYDNAFPILKRKGIPAAVFVVGATLESPQALAHDRLYALLGCFFARSPIGSSDLACLLQVLGINSHPIPKLIPGQNDPFLSARAFLSNLPQGDIGRIMEAIEEKLPPGEGNPDRSQFLSREMLATMNQSGMTIGSHTQTHVVLTIESQGRIRQELEQSRRELEMTLGMPIRHFAYPDGGFNRQAVRAVAAAGYRYAYTTCRHRDPNYSLLTIPRRMLWEKSCLDHHGSFSPAIMSCQVNGLFDFLASCGADHEVNAIRTASIAENRKVRVAL